jgi:hypothetical protein
MKVHICFSVSFKLWSPWKVFHTNAKNATQSNIFRHISSTIMNTKYWQKRNGTQQNRYPTDVTSAKVLSQFELLYTESYWLLSYFISMPFLTFHPHYKWRGTQIFLHWIKAEDTKLIICIISLCFLFNIWCHFRSSRKFLQIGTENKCHHRYYSYFSPVN